MKKHTRTLRLGKETLQRLSDAQMQTPALAGGIAQGGVSPISQAGDSCLQSCYFNTCYAGCVWQAQAGLA